MLLVKATLMRRILYSPELDARDLVNWSFEICLILERLDEATSRLRGLEG